MIAIDGHEPLIFQPIGVVRNGVLDAAEVDWQQLVSRIELKEALLPALKGIDEFSHLVVLFHFHRAPQEPPPLQVHPERRQELPLVGVLATRSPQRPNGIGMTVVPLLDRQGTTLTVRGLDALDGTPVLDIKPYLLRGDQVEDPAVPDWLRRLWDSMDETEA